mmetsp:Transcript_27641/g.60195  ORF Transcript_27641/g.60195 Transcript_27641/m.60195 type:complete len:138 (-) Transcript_27641:414-827(-)
MVHLAAADSLTETGPHVVSLPAHPSECPDSLPETAPCSADPRMQGPPAPLARPHDAAPDWFSRRQGKLHFDVLIDGFAQSSPPFVLRTALAAAAAPAASDGHATEIGRAFHSANQKLHLARLSFWVMLHNGFLLRVQ